jgi:hypothetical protein
MIETNIRIVEPGVGLRLEVRRAEVLTQDLSPDLLQRACGALQKRHGLAAVVSPDKSSILVATREPVPRVVVQDDDWRLEVKDSGTTRVLRFTDVVEARLLAQLLERSLLVQLERRTKLWTLDSFRNWYVPEPFMRASGVAAHRRFEVSSVAIEGVGVGLVVDVGTAFFTENTVADFFREDLTPEEAARWQRRFERLSERQHGQKGTLVYDFGRDKHKCYFDSYQPGLTAAAVNGLRVQGQTYPSLQAYYKLKHGVDVDAGAPVAKVSFPGINRPQPVIASALRLRVMNNALPDALKQADKIDPKTRRDYLVRFWKRLGDEPLGRGLPKVAKKFWCPPRDRAIHLKAPNLMFADGRTISAPSNGHVGEHRAYYRERHTILNEAGCLRVPPAMTRVLHVAVPRTIDENVAFQLAEDVAADLSRWTRKEITPELIMYSTVDDALNRLRREAQPGMVLFVFDDDDPAMYFTLAYELKEWRIKRITLAKLRRLAAQFELARNANNPRSTKVTRVPRGWEAFVEMNALDVLQQLDCVPWSLASAPNHEAQLVIDVGADRRYFALSLLICRPQSSEPFRLDTIVPIKSDHKQETINEVILCDEIVKLCQCAVRNGFEPIKSMLILRDGHECGREMDAITNAQGKLVSIAFLSEAARITTVDFHKTSAKGIRLWDLSRDGEARHALEGTALVLDKRTVVLVNTGAATLHQGTAEPLMLIARGNEVDMIAVASDVHAFCQLNWSSPKVAQRLPLALKRTDDELKNRAAQEIRRIK